MTNPTALQAALGDMDVCCETCGYNLRGCTSDHCPECGVPLTLIVGSSDARSGWWLASIFGSGLSTLISIVLLLHIIAPVAAVLQNPQIRMGGFGTSLPRWRSITFTLACALICGGLLCWVVVNRRQFNRLKKINRQLLGLVILASPLALIGLLLLFVRL